MEEKVTNIRFANLVFSGLTKKEVTSMPTSFRQIVTVNAEFIVEANENDHFRNVVNNSCATFDGQLPFIISKFFNKKSYEKISGSDLIYDICDLYKNSDKRIFLLGAGETANRKAVENLKTRYSISVAGYSPPFSIYPFPSELNLDILRRIEYFRPDILFVGFGAIKQEYWIYDNKEMLERLNVKMAIGCGGAIDFASGMIKRAPVYLQKLGLEGIYRLIKEPKKFRLLRIIKSFKMFLYIFKQKS